MTTAFAPGFSHRFRIQARPPFAFDLALAYLRTSPSTIAERITNDCYRRAIWLEGKPRVLTVRQLGLAGTAEPTAAGAPTDGSAPELAGSDSAVLEVDVAGDAIDDADRDSAERLVRRTFATDVDVGAIDRVAEADPVFGALVRSYRGLRPILIPDLFETIVWAIVGQQINVTFAAKCKRALIERFGPRLRLGGGEYLLFPTPDVLAAAPESELAALQLSRQKIRYIHHLAREIVEGRLDLNALAALPAADAEARLEQLVGIGRWTAEYVLLRGLGHPDVIPAADGGLRRIIGEAYGLGRLATEVEVRALAERWAGWRGYAAYYWWFVLQQRASQRRARGNTVTTPPVPKLRIAAGRVATDDRIGPPFTAERRTGLEHQTPASGR